MKITRVQKADLGQIMLIERAGFTPAEAASKNAMQDRIRVIPDSFLVARDQGEVLGYVTGPIINQRYLTDDLFDQVKPNPATGGVQSILSLAVAPQSQGMGIAGQLLNQLAQNAEIAGRSAITLTCLERLVEFYGRSGYVDEGISSSTHGGEVWHNMVLDLPKTGI